LTFADFDSGDLKEVLVSLEKSKTKRATLIAAVNALATAIKSIIIAVIAIAKSLSNFMAAVNNSLKKKPTQILAIAM